MAAQAVAGVFQNEEARREVRANEKGPSAEPAAAV